MGTTEQIKHGRKISKCSREFLHPELLINSFYSPKKMTEEKHCYSILNVELSFLKYGYVNCDTNILKMHMCANKKKPVELSFSNAPN